MMHVWTSNNVLPYHAIHFYYIAPNVATTIDKTQYPAFRKVVRERRMREDGNEEFISTGAY